MQRRPPLAEITQMFGAVIAKVGTTTTPGAGTGDSIFDASLIGSGAHSFENMVTVLYPGYPNLTDCFHNTAFDNTTGEITFEHAYKSVVSAIPAGVPYIITSLPFASALALASLVAKLGGATQVGVHGHLNNLNWQTVFQWTPLATRRKILSIWMDFSGFAAALQTVAYRLSYKVDGVNYRIFDDNTVAPWKIDSNDGVLIVWNEAVDHDFMLEIQMSQAEAGAVNVPYEVIFEDMT